MDEEETMQRNLRMLIVSELYGEMLNIVLANDSSQRESVYI